MTWSFSLGRFFGSDLRVHVTFFLLLAWVGYSGFVSGGATGAIWNLAFIVVLFGCVVAHEYGHALAARRFGIGTQDITLLPIGGMARLERMPEDPRQEIVVALAGPAVNVVVWLVLTVLLGARTDMGELTLSDMSGTDFLAQIAAVNLFLAVFNMIPAFPMDGGRVFRAVLALRMDRVRATRYAALAGQGVALLLGFAGLSTGSPILVLIALFVFIAANAESQDVAFRAISRRMLARDAMITRFEGLAPTDDLDAAAAALLRTTQHEFPVLNADKTLFGVLTRRGLLAAIAGDTPRRTPVSAVADMDIPTVGLMSGLEAVLDALHRGVPAVAVGDPEGRVIGYITQENLGELMVLHGR